MEDYQKNESDWTVVDAFTNEIYARLAQIALDKENIESRIQDSYLVSVQPLFSQAVGGVKLLVKETDESQAKIILQQYHESEMRAAKEAESQCPYCGAGHVRRLELPGWQWLFIVATLGIGGLIFYKKFECPHCGHRW